MPSREKNAAGRVLEYSLDGTWLLAYNTGKNEVFPAEQGGIVPRSCTEHRAAALASQRDPTLP